MKIMTEAIQRVRGEIATPSAGNDKGERARSDNRRRPIMTFLCVINHMDEHAPLTPLLANDMMEKRDKSGSN